MTYSAEGVANLGEKMPASLLLCPHALSARMKLCVGQNSRAGATDCGGIGLMRSGARSLVTAAAFLLAWGMTTWCVAGSYRFDLTHLVEPGADFYLDVEVDLGMAFKHIDSA